MKRLLELFPYQFPVKDCTVKDSREEGIYNGNKSYWVLLKDKRFNEYMIKQLKPYICIFEGETLYGWTDGNNVFDNKENSIHNDNLQVIGIAK